MRIEQITFTRFIAAIAIVIFHYGINVSPFNHESIAFIFQQSFIGVSYFFILSGFVMIIAYQNKPKISALEYYKNRFARIYPIYLVALLLVVVYKLMEGAYINNYQLTLNLLAIQSWIPKQALTMNMPGWPLSVEFLFYAVFPILFNYVYSKKDSIRKCVIPILLFFIATQIYLHWFIYSGNYTPFPSKSHNFSHYFPLMHLNEFLIGNLAGLFFVKIAKEKTRNYDLHVLVVLILIVLAFKYPVGLNFHDGLLGVLFVPFIMFVSLNNGLITAFFKQKFLVFLGEISFGIYILQFPVFLFANYYLEKFGIIDKTITFYLTVVILIVASALSYYFIETPLRNLIKNLGQKKKPGKLATDTDKQQ